MSAMFKITSPQDIAMEYGGNKQKIARAAQQGIISPTDAVLAGMFIDRTRNAATEEGQSQTVADEVLAPQQSNVGAAPAAGQGIPSTQPTPAQGVAPTPQMPPQAPMPQGMADGGEVDHGFRPMPGNTKDANSIPPFLNGNPLDLFANIPAYTRDSQIQAMAQANSGQGPVVRGAGETDYGFRPMMNAQQAQQVQDTYSQSMEDTAGLRNFLNAFGPFFRNVKWTATKAAAGGGVNNLDVPSAMYDYAPGGLVAFAAGDPVSSDVRRTIDDTYEKLIKAAKSPEEREKATQWYQNALLSSREAATEFVNSQRLSVADAVATIPEGGDELPPEPMYNPRPSSALPEGRSTPLVDMDAIMGKRTQEAQGQQPWDLSLPKGGSEIPSYQLAKLEKQGKLPPEVQQMIASETDPLAGFDNPSIPERANPLSGIATALFDPTQRKAATMSRLERQQMTGQYPIDPDAPGEDMNNPLVQVLQAQQQPAAKGLGTLTGSEVVNMLGEGRGSYGPGEMSPTPSQPAPTPQGGLGTLTGAEVIDMLGERKGTGANETFVSNTDLTQASISSGATPEETVSAVTKASGFGSEMDALIKQFEPESFGDFQAKMLKMMEPEAKGQYRQEMEALINDRSKRLEEGKKEAFNFGLIRAGLGMLAQGGGQTALQALGKAATPAIDTYVKEVKDLKKEDRELLKLGLAMEQMDAKEKNALKRVMAEAYGKERTTKMTTQAGLIGRKIAGEYQLEAVERGRSAENRLMDALGPEGYAQYKKDLAASGTEAGALTKSASQYATALNNWNKGYEDAVTAQLSTARLAQKGIKPNDANAVAAEKARLEADYMARYPKPKREDFAAQVVSTTPSVATAATPTATPQGTVVQPQAQPAPAKNAFSPKGAGTATAPFQLTSKPNPQNLKDGKFYTIAGKRYQWDATAQKFNPK